MSLSAFTYLNKQPTIELKLLPRRSSLQVVEDEDRGQELFYDDVIRYSRFSTQFTYDYVCIVESLLHSFDLRVLRNPTRKSGLCPYRKIYVRHPI